MKNKGFTLVEVLAVIILLGLIASIIIPNYNKSIENSKKKAFEESLNGLVRSIENYVANNSNASNYTSVYTNISSIDLEADNLNQIKSGEFIITNGTVVLRNVYNGRYCGNGHKGEFVVFKGTC
jgi:prepilin-type N-terminal cleavage/methylation domain-containing protein